MSIKIENVRKSFGTFHALNGVNLEIPSGELVALLGPSGSGKTTLLRILAGLEAADSGRILVEGRDTSGDHVRDRQVGFVFQHYALFRHLTIFENVAYGLRVKPRGQRPTKEYIQSRVSELLKLVQLDWLGDRYPAQLSGGQRQRIALARALAVEPRLLLLDEPFGALDAKVRLELRHWLRRLHDELGITSVFVTHDQEEAMEVSDRVVILNKGQIEQVGTPEEVFDLPKTRFVAEFIGKTNILLGRLEEGEKVLLQGGPTVRVATRHDYKRGAEISVCIRPHNLFLVGNESESREWGKKGYNVLCGVIQRRIYFGDAIDYTVEISDQRLSLRIVAPPSCRYEGGKKVFAVVHPNCCVILAED